MNGLPVVIRKLDHCYGEGELRRQVLHDITTEVRHGEMVILTGPSGSGKTTLLTLIGALRSAQQGSLRVLGRELRGASEATLVEVRRRIGYVFQQHNLLESLSARQNVQMALQLDGGLSMLETERRAAAALEAVGLADRSLAHPSELSGGERQRVAVARALSRRPEIVLADEPTASLDRDTGRAVVDLLQKLARRDSVTVIMVTHDNRILDVADRILAIEDGRLTSFLGWVGSDTRRLLRLLVEDMRRGELAQRVQGLDERAFASLLETLTHECAGLLEVVDVVQSEVFESVLEQFVAAFTAKLRELFGVDQARLFFLDESGDELWALARCEHGALRELRLPSGRAAGAPSNVLAVPVADSQGRRFALLELSREANAGAFDSERQRRLEDLARSLARVLESWWRMSCDCRRGRVGVLPPCCRRAQAETAEIER